MDRREYDAWMEVTNKSKDDWTLDSVQYYNRKTIFMYKGGEDGQFVEITEDGVMTIGNYVGAVPHIGEAFFSTLAKKKYENQQDALKRAVEGGKMSFLKEFIKR